MVKMQVYYMEVGMCLTSYDGINTSICLYFLWAYILFKITNRIIPMRVLEESEMGLDLSQHDETLFPIECAD
jgi:ammonia channel protein AmtB